MAKKTGEKRRGVNMWSKEKYEKVFLYFNALEKNDMNVTQTAKELGIPPSTLENWVKDEVLLSKYKRNKGKIHAVVEKNKAERVVLLRDAQQYKDMAGNTFTKLIGRINEILDDDEKASKVKFYELIKGMEIIAPYLMDKQHIEGTVDPKSPLAGQSVLMQNIIMNMNKKLPQKTEDDENSENKV